MGLFKNIRLGIGFLLLASTPPYIVYDFHRLIDGEGTSSDRVLLAMTCCAAGALILWLLRQRGMDYARLKILWDWPTALVMLIISAPVLLFTAVLIKLESAGPVIYNQERVGRNRRRNGQRRKAAVDGFPAPGERRKGGRRQRDLGGRPFIIYKLRSMLTTAENESGAAWSSGDSDPRLTRVGYFIRRTHIDELPQFFNVLLGQMSIIGPRPERPVFVAELNNVIKNYRRRLDVAPGITGLAQIRQDPDESIEDVKKKLRRDRKYIQNCGLLFDVRIIIETIALIVHLLVDSLIKKKTERVEPTRIEGLTLQTIHAKRK
jgi:lipopolysaccharide/colanic/teichoic acid biosynthesis glycosyltransferase